MKRKLKSTFAIAVAAMLALSFSACGQKVEQAPATQPAPAVEAPAAPAAPAAEVKNEIEKPSKITAMIDTVYGSMVDPKTWAPFEAKYKELTGIELKMTKPDHNQYYEQMSLAFASGSAPDVMEIGSINYPTYAINGALWDMTEAWNNSELKASGNATEKYVDGLKIDGTLYGFPMAKGNGTLTYVRKDWLDNLGLAAPTTYDEFVNVMRAFTEDDPDQNGKKDTYGITAAGLINTETPYAIYLREFYQDAVPDFVLKDGKYVDGMSEPNMVAALTRMKDAYNKGYVDKEIVTNKTSTSRDKFYAGQVGLFNYWAGNWNVTLENNSKAANEKASVVPLAPIQGVKYLERPSTAIAITSGAENPEGIFKYLIEYSHDGGEGQLLFTRGIEGINYEKNAEGKVVQMPDPENPDKKFEKTWFAPELTFTKFQDVISFDPRLTSSLALFEQTSELVSVPRASEVYSENLPDLSTARQKAIANAVTTDMSVEDAIAGYQKEAKTYVDNILADFNK